MLTGQGAALAAAVSVLAGGEGWEWRSGFHVGGECLHLRLDGLGAFFLVLLCVVGGAAGHGSGFGPGKLAPGGERDAAVSATARAGCGRGRDGRVHG